MKDKLLVLDLDETLIYASTTALGRAPDFMVEAKYHVLKRPGLDAFLNYCFTHFMVAVWTSSSPSYAAAVVPAIFKTPSELRFIWARDRCTLRQDSDLRVEHWIKPLRKIKKQGFTLQQALMIDDSPEKMVKNFGNHICVRPFEGDQTDNELALLARYLETLKQVPNVTSIEKRYWKTELENHH